MSESSKSSKGNRIASSGSNAALMESKQRRVLDSGWRMKLSVVKDTLLTVLVKGSRRVVLPLTRNDIAVRLSLANLARAASLQPDSYTSDSCRFSQTSRTFQALR